MLNIKIINYQTGEFKQKTLEPNSDHKFEWLLGRKADCDLVLSSPEISRVHGRIIWQQGQYYYSDLGSTDGSRINHEVIPINCNYLLKEDDLLRIGSFIVAIESIKSTKAQQTQNLNSGSNLLCQWSSDDLVVRCQQIIDETPDVKTFRFVAEQPMLFTYEPGQFINIELTIAGKPVVRSYSISSPPSRPSSLEITVKRVPAPTDVPNAPPGLVSNWLHDNLQVGSQVKLVGKPTGKFTCTVNPPPKLLMISAGSGITPMISMSRWIYDTVKDCDVVFFHNARSPEDIIMRQELEMLAARQANFRLAVSITRPQLGQPWLGFMGRLDEATIESIAPDFRDRTVYVCGPNGFMSAVKQMFSDLNFPMANYNEESFGGAKIKKEAKSAPAIPGMASTSTDKVTIPNQQSSASPVVFFSQLGQEVACDGEESILEIAEQEGVAIRSGCRQGVCGACKKRKLEGEIRYEGEPDGLDENERNNDFILPCIAFPVGKVVIEA
jgi:glycine betaine catabolism B